MAVSPKFDPTENFYLLNTQGIPEISPPGVDGLPNITWGISNFKKV